MATPIDFQEVVVTANPKGTFEEGIISGTGIYPGSILTQKAGVAMDDSGAFTWEAYNADSADGERFPVAVATEQLKLLIGETKEDAFVDGERVMIYFPAMGELLKMRFKNVSGTADDYSIGQRLIVDDGTGELIGTTGTVEQEPFQMLEVVTDPEAAFWALVRYTGC